MRFSARTRVQRVPISISAVDCVPGTSGVQVGRAVEVSGRMSAPLRSTPTVLGLTGPRTSRAWPLTGGLPGVPTGNKGEFTAVRGLEGKWVIPPAATNEVNLGQLAGTELVEGANPPLQDSGKLRWSTTSSLQPVVRLADTLAVAQLQQWLVPLGILLGLTGSVLASMFFEWVKPRTLPPPDPATPALSSTAQPHAPPEPVTNHHTGRKPLGTALAVATAVLIGYLIGRRR